MLRPRVWWLGQLEFWLFSPDATDNSIQFCSVEFCKQKRFRESKWDSTGKRLNSQVTNTFHIILFRISDLNLSTPYFQWLPLGGSSLMAVGSVAPYTSCIDFKLPSGVIKPGLLENPLSISIPDKSPFTMISELACLITKGYSKLSLNIAALLLQIGTPPPFSTPWYYRPLHIDGKLVRWTKLIEVHQIVPRSSWSFMTYLYISLVPWWNHFFFKKKNMLDVCLKIG